MKVKFTKDQFVISNGETDSVRVKTNENNFDEILSLFFVPKVGDVSKRTRTIRFE